MKFKKFLTCVLAAAIAAGGFMSGKVNYSFPIAETVSAAGLNLPASAFPEAAYVTWSPVSGADGYNAYIKPEGGSYTQLDSMLIRQYNGYFRADAVGLKAGKYIMKVVPTSGGKENASGAMESAAITVSAHDRSGFGWVGGSSSGAYNEDGTLKSNAVVVYVTDENKDKVTVNLNVEGKGEVPCVGVQNIITGYKKGKEERPISIRFIGNITDPANMPKGDLYVDTAKAGMTIEGIGNDATFNGFGLVLKGCSNVEVRNLGFMNCNSTEGDNVGLQQDDDHCWVHHCDFFYGEPGSATDQVKGDGALDTKKSHYITHSYNHFWDNGKCNLQGGSTSDTSDFITYHHNWYDHSDSRHPRVRVASVHVYNNYYDGNAKYGIGATTGASVFAENNYFRNCKSPILTAMQGSDILENAKGTFSGENGGVIKAFGNYMTGHESFVPYSQNNKEYDAYDASSAAEKVPSSVVAKTGGATYNNFDTDSNMYKYTADKAEDVPAKVMAGAGRVDGGDFKWTFNNAVDDADSNVNAKLKAALLAYDDSIVAIGSGFKDQGELPPTEPTQPVTQPTQPTATDKPVETDPIHTTVTQPPSVITGDAIYCAPDAPASGKGTKDSPVDVVTAISMVQPGGTIYLLGGTYKFSETILIDSKNCGTADKYKVMRSYPGEKVVWDFSDMSVSGSNRGIVLDGDYWWIKGFEITKAGDNGMLLAGNNNIIELMEFTYNQDTGLQLSRFDTNANSIAEWPSNNLVLNCTARNNCDDATMENADGFAAKLTCGEGNIFDGCMSYNNSDDGWDLYAKTETGPIGVVTIRNCMAFRNGYTEQGKGFGDCDGNGFKLGGAGVGTAHIVENCIAFENLNCGFTDNNNPKLGSLTNCTAYNNGAGGSGKPNVSCYRCTDGCTFKNMITYINNDKLSELCGANPELNVKVANDKFVGTIEKSIYFNGGYYYIEPKTPIVNGGKVGEKGEFLTADSFVSLDVPAYRNLGKDGTGGFDFHTEWRNEDGTINNHGFLELKDAKYAGMGASLKDVKLPSLPSVTPVPNPPTTETQPIITGVTQPTETEPIITGISDITVVTSATTGKSEVTSISVVSRETETTAEPEETETSFMTSAVPMTSIIVETSQVTSGTVVSVVTITEIVTYTETQIITVPITIIITNSETVKPVTNPTTETSVAPVTENIPDGNHYGDVNLDDKVNVADVVSLNLYLLSQSEYPIQPDGKANADVMRDNSIDTSDSSLLMNFVAELVGETELGRKL